MEKFIACLELGEEAYRPFLADCEEQTAALGTLYGEECVGALETYYACFSEAACEEEWEQCASENTTFVQVCVTSPGETCSAYEAKEAECSEPEPELARTCQMSIDLGGELHGEECAAAYDSYFACEASLECDSSGCDAEAEAISVSCV